MKETNNFDEASRQMRSVILRIIKESFGDSMYDKAIDCLQLLRNEVLKVE